MYFFHKTHVLAGTGTGYRRCWDFNNMKLYLVFFLCSHGEAVTHFVVIVCPEYDFSCASNVLIFALFPSRCRSLIEIKLHWTSIELEIVLFVCNLYIFMPFICCHRLYGSNRANIQIITTPLILFDHMDDLLNFAKCLSRLHFEHIFPSTGHLFG